MPFGPLTRRTFLAGLAASALVACSDDDTGSRPSSTGPTTAPARPNSTGIAGPTTVPPTVPTGPSGVPTPPVQGLGGNPFTLGVASGDPLPDAVVLWTRLVPAQGPAPTGILSVRWEVATDEGFANRAFEGLAPAVPQFGHSVHVDVKGLKPATTYWYRFSIGSWTSPVGRTRTAPADGAAVDRLRVAVASCQHFEGGLYGAWADAAAADLDLVVFLGDYVYESPLAAARVRRHVGSVPVTLDEYRVRYAQYKADPNLQAAHARCPWLVIWDDHEVENNYAADRSARADATPEQFRRQRAAAYQAWWEHQPVRLDPPTGPDYRIHRSFAWGALATFVLTDGRQYRSDQACGDAALQTTPACPEAADPGRTMWGAEQEAWVLDQLGAARTTWNVVANQVVMGDLRLPNGAVVNYDQWDGYAPARRRVLTGIAERRVSNLVVLSGDIHLAAAVDLVLDDPARTVVGTELVTTSISSPGRIPGDVSALAAQVVPAVKYLDGTRRGYARCTITPQTWTCEYRAVADVAQADSAVSTDATVVVTAGTPGAVRR